MKQLGTLIILVIAGMLSFTSCDEDTITQLPYAQINDFFEVNKPQSEVYNITIGSDDYTFTLINGSEVIIYNNAICEPSGLPATGDVKVEFKEVFKKSEMIFEQKTTESDGKLLESGGEFYMKVTQNGSPMNICGGVQIKIPKSDKTSDPSQMMLFKGDSDGDEFNWVADSTQNEFWVDSSDYNVSLFGDFDWINCDYFYSESGPKTTVSAIPVGNGGTSTNTKAYIIFKDINAVGSLLYNGLNNQFESYENSLPIGQEATIIILGMSDTDFYFGSEEITVSTDLVVNINLDEVTEAELLTAIEALN